MLFSLIFVAMATDASVDSDIGIGIRYHMDGSILTLEDSSEN